jgi:hypothetical protein
MKFLRPSFPASLLAFALAAPLLLAAQPPKYFRADPPDSPALKLPDPLLNNAGKKITTAEEWKTSRRAEVLELFRQQVYGRVPATPFQTSFKIVQQDPKAMNGAATLKRIDVILTSGGKSLTIHLSLFTPNAAKQPSPAFLLICNRPAGENIDPTRQKKSEFWPAEEAIARGYAMAAFFNGDVDPDLKTDTGFKDGIHPLLDRGQRPPDAWATLAAWAWGASRCMDYLVTDKAIARDRVAVIGHSRGGKTALWASAEDERFAMACSNCSGCGGATLYRHRTKEKETIAVINRAFPHWFDQNFKQYADRELETPFDANMLIALTAPRPVCVGSAAEDLWADPRGEFLSVANARSVYQLFGKQALGANPTMPAIGDSLHGDAAHYHVRDGKHNLTLVDWTAYMDFADRTWGKPKQ